MSYRPWCLFEMDRRYGGQRGPALGPASALAAEALVPQGAPLQDGAPGAESIDTGVDKPVGPAASTWKVACPDPLLSRPHLEVEWGRARRTITAAARAPPHQITVLPGGNNGRQLTQADPGREAEISTSLRPAAPVREVAVISPGTRACTRCPPRWHPALGLLAH
jgi:hypothetical protein